MEVALTPLNQSDRTSCKDETTNNIPKNGFKKNGYHHTNGFGHTNGNGIATHHQHQQQPQQPPQHFQNQTQTQNQNQIQNQNQNQQQNQQQSQNQHFAPQSPLTFLLTSSESHLIFLLKTDPTNSDLCTLLKRQDQSLKQFYTNIKSLQEKGFCRIQEQKLFLTEKGEQIVSQTKVSFGSPCSVCHSRSYCQQTSLERPSNGKATPSLSGFEIILEEYRRIVKERPTALPEFDQWYMSPEDACLRIALFYDRGDLLNKTLLIIGDDDLLGIAAALTGLPKEVVVLEIDERIITFINEVAEKWKNCTTRFDEGRKLLKPSPLLAKTYDIRQPLPEHYLRYFDTFACDPVETVDGCKLFLSRGVAGLRGAGSALYFGLTSLECSKQKTLQIQKLVSNMGFTLTDNLRNFTEYPDPGWEEQLPIWKNLKVKPTSTWYKSALFRWEAVCNPPEPLIQGEYTGEWNFFLDDESWATTQEKV